VITHLSFDGDDTLWEFDRVMRAALEEALGHLRSRHADLPAAQELTIADLAAARDQVGAAFAGEPALSLWHLRRRAFARTLEGLGRPDDELAEQLCAIFYDGRSALIEPYDDVVPALDALAGRYTLALVSNGNADVERCVLRGRFAFRVHAHDHGVAKPDPALFEVVFAQAGIGPDALVHVGDALEYDVAGARAAGVRAVWLNRHGARNESGVEPDHEIRSLAELPTLLERVA
jgi:putative hydrolase of the HAD superfamily